MDGDDDVEEDLPQIELDKLLDDLGAVSLRPAEASPRIPFRNSFRNRIMLTSALMDVLTSGYLKLV